MADTCNHERVVREQDFWECESCGLPFVPEVVLHEANARTDLVATVASDLLWRFHQRVLASSGPGVEPYASTNEVAPEPLHQHDYADKNACACGYSPFLGSQQKSDDADPTGTGDDSDKNQQRHDG